MTKATTDDIVAEIIRTFGTPVVSWENKDEYRAIVAGLVTSFPTRDFFDKMTVNNMAWSVWTDRRYAQHQNLTIEDRAMVLLQHQAKREALAAARLKRNEDNAGMAADVAGAPNPDLARRMQLDDVVQELLEDIDLRGADDRVQFKAMASAIDEVAKVDALRTTNDERFNDAVRLYHEHADRHPRPRVSPEVIDGEFEVTEVEEVEAEVPLVPSNEETK